MGRRERRVAEIETETKKVRDREDSILGPPLLWETSDYPVLSHLPF